jgi:hypothetical protein
VQLVERGRQHEVGVGVYDGRHAQVGHRL